LQSPDVFEPNPCSHGSVDPPSIAVPCGGVFRFLYFCPLEDDLDFDEEVEEARRRWRRLPGTFVAGVFERAKARARSASSV